jgi:hypothetical protein
MPCCANLREQPVDQRNKKLTFNLTLLFGLVFAFFSSTVRPHNIQVRHNQEFRLDLALVKAHVCHGSVLHLPLPFKLKRCSHCSLITSARFKERERESAGVLPNSALRHTLTGRVSRSDHDSPPNGAFCFLLFTLIFIFLVLKQPNLNCSRASHLLLTRSSSLRSPDDCRPNLTV